MFVQILDACADMYGVLDLGLCLQVARTLSFPEADVRDVFYGNAHILFWIEFFYLKMLSWGLFGSLT